MSLPTGGRSEKIVHDFVENDMEESHGFRYHNKMSEADILRTEIDSEDEEVIVCYIQWKMQPAES